MKPFNKLTRQDFIDRNNAIPSERTKKANNTEKIPMPNAEQYEGLISEWNDIANESVSNMTEGVTNSLYLRIHGICPKTFNFLPGYDKNGKIPASVVETKPTFAQKVLKFFKLQS